MVHSKPARFIVLHEGMVSTVPVYIARIYSFEIYLVACTAGPLAALQICSNSHVEMI